MTDTTVGDRAARAAPPLTRPIRYAVAVCLAGGAALSAIPQYVEKLVAGDLETRDQISWGLAHQGYYRVEWLGGMLGSYLLLFGFLGLWQVTRWSTPKLTALGAVVLTWGMSGQIFSETATYVAQVVTADVLGPVDATRLIDEGYLHDPGVIALILVPVIVGMFVGLCLLAAALWRSGVARTPVVLLVAWPLWDFFGPGRLGPISAELFLLVAGLWLGVVVAMWPHSRWLARDT